MTGKFVEKTGKFRLGGWTVDPSLDHITRGCDQVSLQPQVMDLLVYLCRHQGEVISTDELLSHIWGDRVVTRSSIYSSLKQLRSALGDDVRDPKYIATIPKRGYRLIADVDFAGEHSLAGVEVANVGETRRFRAKGSPVRVLSLAAILFILIAVLLASHYRTAPGEAGVAPQPPPERSIAVLPFKDLSPGKVNQHFSEGVSGEIINMISRHPNLKVVGRTSSFQFRDPEIDLREIGRRLGVAFVLEGSIYREDDHFRISAYLTEANEGNEVWSRHFDTPIDDVIDIQEQIAASIVKELELADLPAYGRDQVRALPGQPQREAYELLLLARHRINQGGQSANLAVSLLQQALEIDPEFPQARVELAYALHAQPPKQGLANRNSLDGPVMRQAEMALALDPYLAGAYAMIGTLHYINAWNGFDVVENVIRAEANFKRALELNPNNARALLWFSGLKRLQGKPWLESVALANKAVELEPLWVFAVEHYLHLIEQLPAYQDEQELKVKRVKSGWINSSSGSKHLESRLLLMDGELAAALEILEQDHPHENSDLRGQYLHDWTHAYLGNLKTEWEYRPDNTTRSFRSLLLAKDKNTPDLCAGFEELHGNTQFINSCGFLYLISGRYNQAADALELGIPAEETAFLAKFGHTFIYMDNSALNLATVNHLRGDQASTERYVHMVESFIGTISEEGKLQATFLEPTRALCSALSGREEAAFSHLSSAINQGFMDYRLFMHPVWLNYRNDERFLSILTQWLTAVNFEREKLGMKSLQPNPAIGPGELPFILE